MPSVSNSYVSAPIVIVSPSTTSPIKVNTPEAFTALTGVPVVNFRFVIVNSFTFCLRQLQLLY